MIIRDFHKEKTTDRRVGAQQWELVRLLLADDGMGFSFHITTIAAGSEHTFHYKNHFESVYCVAGEGSIEDLATGEVHELRPVSCMRWISMTSTHYVARPRWSLRAASTRPSRARKCTAKTGLTRWKIPEPKAGRGEKPPAQIPMTYTVEKIGGTCMSRARELLDTLYVGDRDQGAIYNRVFVVSAFGGITNMLLEHKKTGSPGVYARFSNDDSGAGWAMRCATPPRACAKSTARFWTMTVTANALTHSCVTGSRGRAPVCWICSALGHTVISA